MAISGTRLFGGRSAHNQRQSEAIRGNHWKSEAISGNQWHSPVRRPLGAPPRAERTGAARARSRTCNHDGNHDGNQAHPMARSEAIWRARDHDGNQSGALEIWRAPFEISHDLRRHRVVRVGEHLWGEGGTGAVVSTCMLALTCASVSTRNRSASRSRWHATRTGMRPMNSGSSPWRTCGELSLIHI